MRNRNYPYNTSPLDKSELPHPVFEDNEPLVELYWKAWETAWKHVITREGAPQSPYMDEAHDTEKIWIWDTCFMVLFARYAPHVFPGIQSLRNFYGPMHDHQPSTLDIWHMDNPPLLAWCELQHALMTGDREYIKHLLHEKAYLQKHYAFIENCRRWERYPGSSIGVYAERRPEGFLWGGNPSGMDNTPRGRRRTGIVEPDRATEEHLTAFWFDLLAQQGLSARCIAQLARCIDDTALAAEYDAKCSQIRQLLDAHYWNDADGIYYDCRLDAVSEQIKVKTPAAYWPMLAGLCNADQAEALARHAADPETFGGERPWPSVSRDDPDFMPTGCYWRGGIWLPTAYAGTKALEQYGYHDLADSLSENLLHHMLRTYSDYEPHTLWEAYSPTEPRPCTTKNNRDDVDPDFCGWSALGPISLFIENILGFHGIDAFSMEIHWRRKQRGRHGIQNLRFGGCLTDIIAEAPDSVRVASTLPYTLVINGKRWPIQKGTQILKVT